MINPINKLYAPNHANFVNLEKDNINFKPKYEKNTELTKDTNNTFQFSIIIPELIELTTSKIEERIISGTLIKKEHRIALRTPNPNNKANPIVTPDLEIPGKAAKD